MRSDARSVEAVTCVSLILFLVGIAALAVIGQKFQMIAPDDVLASDEAYADRIDVHWNAVAGAMRYEVYRSTFLQHMYIPIAMTTDLSVSDKQIQASQYYYYKVRACQGG
ncbi:hypothetical protein KKG90_09925 [Candidatus Bipolaricaulota bacterium]|nr:hypothetical protein [Candidatus Bipolaricaulota bacterium]